MATGLLPLIVTPHREIRDRLSRLLDPTRRAHVAWWSSMSEGSHHDQTPDIDLLILDARLPDAAWRREIRGLAGSMLRALPVVVIVDERERERAQDVLSTMDGDWIASSDLDRQTLLRCIRYAQERRASSLRLASVRQRLEMLASIDPLTRCLNRRGLEHAARKFCAAASTDVGLPSFALLTDLDNFKSINDDFGHATGDVMLQEVSSVIRRYLRPSDVLARVGGDEFLVLLRCLSREEASHVAERLRAALDETCIEYEGEAVRVTASVGISEIATDGATVSEMLHSTHRGLKRCKRRGKNQQAWSTAASPDSDRVTPEDQVMLAMSRGESITVVCQPIIDLSAGTIESVELLTRGPNGAFESPNDFFRVAQERQLVNTIDMKCLEACLHATRRGASYHVNLLPSTILSVGGERLARLFREASAKHLCLEISEKQIVANPRYLIEHLAPIREASVEIAIDDVGFGRSCLESLIVLKPDTIKIDRAWVQGVHKNKDHAIWLKRLCAVASALDTHVVAEGVESRAELRWLMDHGVARAQGYLWGRPAPVDTYIDEAGNFISLGVIGDSPRRRDADVHSNANI